MDGEHLQQGQGMVARLAVVVLAITAFLITDQNRVMGATSLLLAIVIFLGIIVEPFRDAIAERPRAFFGLLLAIFFVGAGLSFVL